MEMVRKFHQLIVLVMIQKPWRTTAEKNEEIAKQKQITRKVSCAHNTLQLLKILIDDDRLMTDFCHFLCELKQEGPKN